MYSKPPDQQLKELEDQLRDMYLGVCDTYMQMSKVKDTDRLDRMQSGVDGALQRVTALRQKIAALQKPMIDISNSSDKWQINNDKAA